MTRIFTSLAIFAVVFVLATFALGLSLRAGDLRDRSDTTTQNRGTVHRLSGIAAGVCVVLVNSIVVTYFIGTSRWCKEVCDTYGLDRTLVARSTRLKRRTFPVATFSMLVAVAIVALGGAADPGAVVPPPNEALHVAALSGVSWANLHLVVAAAGLATIVGAFVVEWNQIEANHAVINDVLAEVRRIRTERGLD